MGILAGELLGLELPQKHKRLFVFVETDGCFVDGISAATSCSMGHRTMRLMDYGKVAACFIDTQTEKAFRIVPNPNSRQIAQSFDAPSRWERYMQAYQSLPHESLFCIQAVQLNLSLQAIISHARHRAFCAHCHEEIICQPCANGAYYR
jgi:formylmethanofuran dehydrogenase subunit E